MLDTEAIVADNFLLGVFRYLATVILACFEATELHNYEDINGTLVFPFRWNYSITTRND